MKNKKAFILGMVVTPILAVSLTLVFAGTASVPNTFVANTPAVAAEVNANFASLVTAINANAPKYTRLFYNGSASDATVSTTYEQFRVVGMFTKQATDTDVVLHWNTHLRVQGAAGQFGDWELRIDGAEPDEGSRVVIYTNPDGDNNQNANTTVRFTGLAAGAREVQIWSRGNAATLSENRGSFTRQVLVEEVFSN